MTLHAPLILDIAGTELTDVDRRRLAHPLTGGMILFGRNWQSRAQLSDLCAELLVLAGPACGAELQLAPLVDRLCQYSLAIADYRGAVKEWPWRNGWFVAEAQVRGVACPLHTQVLQRLGR